jgi:hypothetical protein
VGWGLDRWAMLFGYKERHYTLFARKSSLVPKGPSRAPAPYLKNGWCFFSSLLLLPFSLFLPLIYFIFHNKRLKTPIFYTGLTDIKWILIDSIATFPFVIEVIVLEIQAASAGNSFWSVSSIVYSLNEVSVWLRMIRLLWILRLLKIVRRIESVSVGLNSYILFLKQGLTFFYSSYV